MEVWEYGGMGVWAACPSHSSLFSPHSYGPGSGQSTHDPTGAHGVYPADQDADERAEVKPGWGTLSVEDTPDRRQEGVRDGYEKVVERQHLLPVLRALGESIHTCPCKQ